MRGSERPQKVRWSRPFLPPLEPLSVSAALRIFVDITGEEYDEAVIRQLLEFTGNLPLAIKSVGRSLLCLTPHMYSRL
jgi:hypothetical protein